MPNYIYAVCGTPGSGKSTFCKSVSELLKMLGRKVKIVNLDPANDFIPYNSDVNINNLIQVSEVMEVENLGPNGALMYSMEYLEKNMKWLFDEFKTFDKSNTFILMDFPGQIELFTHHNSVKNIFQLLQKEDYRICVIYLVDSFCCSDAGSFIAFLTTTLSAMLQLAVPHINVLSKIDLIPPQNDQGSNNSLAFGLDFYTEVLDLQKLVDTLNDDKFTSRYKKLNQALVDVIESFGLVTFIPCTIQEDLTLFSVIKKADFAVGYSASANDNEDGKIEAIIKSKDDTELRELVSRMNEKYVHCK